MAEEATLTFRNHSLRKCKIYLSLLKNNECYLIEPEQLCVDARTSASVTIYALSVKKGTDVSNRLVISVQDNPQPHFINLTSEPCSLKVSFSPKLVSFEQAIVGRVEKRAFCIDNNSSVPVNWSFMDTERVFDLYTVRPKEGFVEPESSQEVVFEYYSDVKQEVLECTLELEVCFSLLPHL